MAASGTSEETSRPRRPSCAHLESLEADEDGQLGPAPSAEGCEDCLRIGSTWVHLRRCVSCGHVGCCDNSPNRHARAHFHEAAHPTVQSYEPGEDWLHCYDDEVTIPSWVRRPSPSHP